MSGSAICGALRELPASTLRRCQEALRLFCRYMTDPAYEGLRSAWRGSGHPSGAGLPQEPATTEGQRRDAADASPAGHHASLPSPTSNNHGVFLLPGAAAPLVAWSILMGYSLGNGWTT